MQAKGAENTPARKDISDTVLDLVKRFELIVFVGIV